MFNLAPQIHLQAEFLHLRIAVFLCQPQDIFGIFIHLFDCIGIARMEGKGNHRLHLAEIHLQQIIVVGKSGRTDFPVFILSFMYGKPVFDRTVRLPNRGNAGGFRRHYIDSVPEVHAEACNSRACKFHDSVFYKSIRKYIPYYIQGHILRTHSGRRRSLHVYQYHRGPCQIIGAAQKLFHQLAGAFPNCHCSQRAVSGMAVRPQNHFSAPGQLLSDILVKNRLVGRNHDSSIFFYCPHPKEMIILVQSSSKRTQAVMTVCKDKGDRKFFHTAGNCRLQHSHICHVMAYKRIKFQPQVLHIR